MVLKAASGNKQTGISSSVKPIFDAPIKISVLDKGF